MDLQAAEKATRNGATAGWISAALSLAIVSFAFFSSASGDLEIWSDPWNFVDVVVIAGLAFGVFRKSRSAALILFVYFIASKIFISVETGQFSGAGMALVFLYFYGRAVQGSFVYHRLRGEEDPSYRPAARWQYFVLPPLGLLGLMLVLVGAASLLHLTPSTEVMRGEELHQREIDLLASEGLIETGEVVVIFYSEGFLSIREGGNILTEGRVISYQESEGELYAAVAEYGDIDDVVVEQKGDFLTDTVISVTTADGNVFQLLASTESEGDVMLIEELRERWEAARSY